MMKSIILTVIALGLTCSSLFANGINNDSIRIREIQERVESIQNVMSRIEQQFPLIEAQRRDILQLTQLFEKQKDSVSILQQKIEKASIQIQHCEKRLDSLVMTFRADIKATDDKITQSDQTLSKRIQSRSWIALAGILFAVILLLVLFVLLRKRINNGATTIDKIRSAQGELERAQKALKEESVKLDGELVELLGKQVETQTQADNGAQPDHSFVLKVADEIVRIEMNLSHMDESVKGYKQLKKAVDRIRTNFLANGYEIVEMLGKSYNDGMKVVANFVSDDTLPKGEQIITGIIKPQINYQGKMIQSAQITVSQNI